MTARFRHSAIPAILAAEIGLGAVSSVQAADVKLNFMTHAAFFSDETKQPKPIDPHAFVHDPAVAAGTGPQNIRHAAGVRPALIDQDARSAQIFTAEDKPLGFTLGQWLGANGSVSIEGGSAPKLSARFAGLAPGGHYSLFENHFDQTPISFTPMDGAGSANNLVANPDGTATISISIPHLPTHANAVLLVYHSDGKDHGIERGEIGVDAHHQLIVRPD